MNKTLARLNISILKHEKERLLLAIGSCKESIYYQDEKHISKLEKKVKDIDRIVKYLNENFLEV